MLDPGAGGGTQLKMENSYVPPLKPPFLSEFFSSSRSYIRLKSQISGKFAFQRLKIIEQTFTLASLIVSYHVGPWSPGGGYSAENGVQLCAALKTPLSRPPDPSLKPPFQNFFSSSRSYICLKSQISGKFAFQIGRNAIHVRWFKVAQ